MAHAANPFAAPRRFNPVTIMGFLIPVALAVLIGLIIGARSRPITQPVQQTTDASGSVTATAPVNQPTAAEVSAANQAILNYCSSDLRADTSCSLLANSTKTAPGFVETGLKLSGTFAVDGASPNGLALAKGSGSSWSVVWVGQSCVPKDVASQNAVPGTLNICSS
ncbi:MAG TPA: hypothetical protein VGM08_02635 [Candidatus Saccharimonadales bacterium]|jgi:hypothetical protein